MPLVCNYRRPMMSHPGGGGNGCCCSCKCFSLVAILVMTMTFVIALAFYTYGLTQELNDLKEKFNNGEK